MRQTSQPGLYGLLDGGDRLQKQMPEWRSHLVFAVHTHSVHAQIYKRLAQAIIKSFKSLISQ